MTAIKALHPESNTSFLHEGIREIGIVCRYASSIDPHCTAATTMKHQGPAFPQLRSELKRVEQVLCLCSLLHTATHTGGGAPGASSQHGAAVGRRKGASPTRCRWQKAMQNGGTSSRWNLHTEVWNPLSPQWDHLSLERHGSFTELGLGGSGKVRVEEHR